jgi:hypothetical protein
MDSDIIYVKTASGEEAMLQRTRVMQRNVRMVLILVDGQSTVADLCGKTGNAQLTENALRELEKGGFIEARVDRQSLWAESKKAAQEISAAAIDQISQLTAPAAIKKAPPTPAAEPPAVDGRVFVHSVFPAPPRSDSTFSQLSQLSQFSMAPMQALRIPAGELPPVPDASARGPFSGSRSAKSERLEPSFVERAKGMLRRPGSKSEERLELKPVRRGQRSAKGWPVAIFGALLILALGYLALDFFPYDFYRPEVEAALAQTSGRPVKVGTMRVVGYPKPGLLLGDVRLGVGEDEIRIAEMRLQPVLGTLRATKMVFNDMALSDVTLPMGLIAGLPGIFAAMAAPASPVSVEHVSFEKTKVSFHGLALSDLDGEAKLSADGLFESLLLRSPDRSLSLEARPEGDRLNVALEGFAWRPALSSAFVFDSLNLQANLDKDVLTISSLELRLFDGLVQGSAVLRADKSPSMLGALSFERINSTRFGNAVGIGPLFSGEAAGKIRFSTTFESWATIFSALEGDGEFTIRRGNIRGIDLTEAVRRISRTPVQGGATIFERLSGKFRLTPTSYQFSGLVLSSGLMQSTGYVDVASKDLKVSGKMDLQIRGTANQSRVPVSISGPLKSPSVQVLSGG